MFGDPMMMRPLSSLSRLSAAVVRCAALLALTFGGSAALAQETEYKLPEPALESDLADENLLLAVDRAGDRLVAVGAHGHVILSDDQGQTWRQASFVPTRTLLTTVEFADEKTGWAGGHDATIIRTTDGGETWELQNFDPALEAAILTLHFKDRQNGIAMGVFSLSLVTSDGGLTWEEASLVPETGLDYHLNGLFESPSGTQFVAAEFGTVYRSTNGGESFETVETDYEGSFWGGLATPEGTVLVHGMRGNIWRSTDDGLTFEKVTSGTNQSLGGSTILEDGTIVMVGLSGAVVASTDDGRTWSALLRKDRKGLNAVAQGAEGVITFGEAGVLVQETLP